MTFAFGYHFCTIIENYILIRDLETEQIKTFRGHQHDIIRACSNDKYIFTIDPYELIVFEFETDNIVHKMDINAERYRYIVADNNYLVLSTLYDFVVLDLNTWKLYHPDRKTIFVQKIYIFNDQVFEQVQDTAIRIWNIKTGQSYVTIEASNTVCNVFHILGRIIIVTRNGTIEFYDSQTYSMVDMIEKKKDLKYVNAFVYKDKLYCLYYNFYLFVIDIATAKIVREDRALKARTMQRLGDFLIFESTDFLNKELLQKVVDIDKWECVQKIKQHSWFDGYLFPEQDAIGNYENYHLNIWKRDF